MSELSDIEEELSELVNSAAEEDEYSGLVDTGAKHDAHKKELYESSNKHRRNFVFGLVLGVVIGILSVYAFSYGSKPEKASKSAGSFFNGDNIGTPTNISPTQAATPAPTPAPTPASKPTEAEGFSVNVDNWKFVTEKYCRTAIAGPPKEENGVETYPQVLPKMAYSNKTRFVFIVGLEGTGHHLWKPIWEACSLNSICLQPPTIPGFKLSDKAMKGGLNGVMISKPQVEGIVNVFLNNINKVISDQPKTYVLNTWGHSDWSAGGGQMSYPSFMPSCRDLSIPDVRLMAELFETVGIDFRLLVVRRDPLDVLISTTVHRHFGTAIENGALYAKVIERSMIGEQLARLDSAFYECLVYEDLNAIPEKIGKFINVDGKGNGNWSFHDEVRKVFHHSQSKDYKDKDDYVKQRFSERTRASYYKLVAATDKLAKFCEGG